MYTSSAKHTTKNNKSDKIIAVDILFSDCLSSPESNKKNSGASKKADPNRIAGAKLSQKIKPKITTIE
jgi:hypothetical protein